MFNRWGRSLRLILWLLFQSHLQVAYKLKLKLDFWHLRSQIWLYMCQETRDSHFFCVSDLMQTTQNTRDSLECPIFIKTWYWPKDQDKYRKFHCVSEFFLSFSEGDIEDKEVSLGVLYQWRECDTLIPRLLTPQCSGCKYKCDSRYCVTLSRARDRRKTLITPGNYDNQANTVTLNTNVVSSLP